MKITSLQVIARNVPNDTDLGNKFKAFAGKRMGTRKVWMKFFKLTRGNSQQLGEKMRSLLSQTENSLSVKKFLKEYEKNIET